MGDVRASGRDKHDVSIMVRALSFLMRRHATNEHERELAWQLIADMSEQTGVLPPEIIRARRAPGR